MNGIDNKAVLFDKDGTLIEYNTIWPDAVRKMIPLFRAQFSVKDDITDRDILRNLGLENYKVNDSSAIASGTTRDIAHVLTSALDNNDEDVLPFVQNYFYQYTVKKKEQILSIGNVNRLFMRLKAEGFTIGIVTADDYHSTVFTMKHLEIEHMIDFLATGDRYPAKPATDAMESFIGEYQIPAERILFVGDSVVDMQFGKHCRKGIAVLSGVGEEKHLRQYTDAVYPTIHDIPYEHYFD